MSRAGANRLIDRLEAAGVLQSVDAALGRLLAAKSAHDGDTVGLIGALASAALAQGHSCLPLSALPDFVVSRLGDDARASEIPVHDLPTLTAMRDALLASPLVARDGIAAAALVLDAHDRVYLRRYFNYEQAVAQALIERAHANSAALLDVQALREMLARHFHGPAADDAEQRTAVLLALRSRFLLVTGGPGAGKTSAVLRLLASALEQALERGQPPPRIALTAPTGKAAARLSETLRAPAIAIGESARAALPQAATTLHRLLGVIPGRSRPRYDRAHLLPHDLIVVDEASMLDLALAARLCVALAPQARLILLGDRDQLASVEAGSVFGALCAAAGAANRYSDATAAWLESILLRKMERVESGPVAALAPLADVLVELSGSHRFGARSAIGRFARAVRAGASAQAQDVLAENLPELSATRIAETALAQTILTRVLAHFAAFALIESPAAALDRLDRFRVLCALREGPFGALAINALIEHELRRRSAHVDAQGWFAGRLVMITSNDYRQGLFNGDIGIALPNTQGKVEVWFRNPDGAARALPPALLPAHEGAFALTVHKAQGSEFDEALIVLPARDARVLTRELLYTAVTRARKKVELWTSTDILAATIARSTQRWSGLAEKLSEGGGSGN
jgi:exodeoxyribonuclease V alpha subunit